MEKMIVFVTGATGFLGRHLCAALLQRGDEVVALEHDTAFHYPVRFDGYAPYEQRLHVVRGDVRDQAVVRRIISRYQVETVVHLAAQTQVGSAQALASEV